MNLEPFDRNSLPASNYKKPGVFLNCLVSRRSNWIALLLRLEQPRHDIARLLILEYGLLAQHCLYLSIFVLEKGRLANLSLFLELIMAPLSEPQIAPSRARNLAKHRKEPGNCSQDSNGHHTLVNAFDGWVLGFVLDHVEVLG